MNLRTHHLLASLLVGAIVLGSLAFLTVSPPAAQASCPTGSGVAITSPTSTTTSSLSGIFTLKAESTPTTATGLSFMLVSPTQQALGEATQNSSSWSLNWDTRNQANGPYQVVAIAHFGTATTLDCASSAVSLNINNTPTQTAKLSATINPNTWQGPVGTSSSFSVDALYIDQYGRSSHVGPTNTNWHSTLGSAAPNGGPSTVFTGGVVGSGLLAVDIYYAGLYATGTAQVKVLAPGTATSTPTPTPTPKLASGENASPTPSPAPTPTPVVSAEDAARLAAMPTIFRPATPTNSDPVVNIPTLSCLEKALGSIRFSEISSGKSEPTAAERKRAAACFSGPEQIPAVLAPVAPTHLTELASTKDVVSVGSIKNQIITSKDGKAVSGLLLSGTGAPNSDIFLYIFSDPLVLRAQTNNQGKWSYVLENPLKSGNHEVYAVAEKDSGNFVRTSAVPISIAAAAPGATNGSLVVERQWSAAQISFAAAAGLLVLAAIGVLFTILRRRHKTPPLAVAGLAPVPPSVPIAPVTPAPLVQPSAPPAESTRPSEAASMPQPNPNDPQA